MLFENVPVGREVGRQQMWGCVPLSIYAQGAHISSLSHNGLLSPGAFMDWYHKATLAWFSAVGGTDKLKQLKQLSSAYRFPVPALCISWGVSHYVLLGKTLEEHVWNRGTGSQGEAGFCFLLCLTDTHLTCILCTTGMESGTLSPQSAVILGDT